MIEMPDGLEDHQCWAEGFHFDFPSACRLGLLLINQLCASVLYTFHYLQYFDRHALPHT